MSQDMQEEFSTLKIPGRLILVKTAWSPTYSGEPVEGNYDYLRRFAGAGHEACNFRPDIDGYYKAHFPNGRDAGYCPTERCHWDVVFVSKPPGESGLRIVGWYENATFLLDRQTRLDNRTASDGTAITYSITAKVAHLVPASERIRRIDGSHFRRTPLVYLDDSRGQEPWRINLRKVISDALKELGYRDDPIQRNQQIGLFSHLHRKENDKLVEAAAFKAVTAHYTSRGWASLDVSQCNFGWDLEFTRGSETLLVQVKGRLVESQIMTLTRNEFNQADKGNWRLAIVSNLANGMPRLRIYRTEQLSRLFKVEPCLFRLLPS